MATREYQIDEHDAFEPFRPEHIGAYDIVHLRFFITLLNADNVHRLFANLLTLLSMCCYLHYLQQEQNHLPDKIAKDFHRAWATIQWLDLNPKSVRTIVAEPTAPQTRTQGVMALMQRTPPGIES